MDAGLNHRSRVLAALALAVLVALLGLTLRAPDGPLGDGLVRAIRAALVEGLGESDGDRLLHGLGPL